MGELVQFSPSLETPRQVEGVVRPGFILILASLPFPHTPAKAAASPPGWASSCAAYK